jgi:hypothetical protein
VIAYFLRSTFSASSSFSFSSFSRSLLQREILIARSLRLARPSSSGRSVVSLAKIQTKFFSSAICTGLARVKPPTSLARISSSR